MKIAVFTSNQARHIALIERLAAVASDVLAIQECTTAFPGQVEDFYRRSETMQRYFAKVIAAETKVFGRPRPLPSNVRTLALRMGDLSFVPLDLLQPALDADLCIIFGSSWIRGQLADALIERGAINLHMGLSPWYRGTACNFWAAADGRFELIGGTVHLLSKGLDSGPILIHALPPTRRCDAFDLGMLAVQSTHQALYDAIATEALDEYRRAAVAQDQNLQIRYTKNRDFTDDVAARYLADVPAPEDIWQHLNRHGRSGLTRPHIWRP